MKIYSSHVVSQETIEKLQEEVSTLKGMVAGSFILNVLISVGLFIFFR